MQLHQKSFADPQQRDYREPCVQESFGHGFGHAERLLIGMLPMLTGMSASLRPLPNLGDARSKGIPSVPHQQTAPC